MPLSRLHIADLRRLRRAQREAATIWLREDPLVELGRLTKALLPEGCVCVYTRGREGALSEVVHDVDGPLRRAPFPWGGQQWIEDNRQYLLQGEDRFSNRAVQTSVLLRGRPDVLEGLRDNVLRPYGTHYQLRVALYDEVSQFVGYCGFARPTRHGEYGPRERAILDSLASLLEDGFAMMQLVGRSPMTAAELARVVEPFDQPAWLVGETGAVLYRNRAARRLEPEVPGWLAAVPRCQAASPEMGRVARIELDGRLTWLVVRRDRPRSDAAEGVGRTLATLPPALARVAELLASGLSDKEIADRVGLSLSTVRTYVARVYDRLGVHGRTQISMRSFEQRPAACSSESGHSQGPNVPGRGR